jgi:hypothetical protein
VAAIELKEFEECNEKILTALRRVMRYVEHLFARGFGPHGAKGGPCWRALAIVL